MIDKKMIILHQIRVISSVGSEHYLDRVGVGGSNPLSPTIILKKVERALF